MRYAVRALLRTPGFTAIAVLTLAIGIGTTTTVFAVVDELIFRRARGAGAADVYLTPQIQIADFESLAAAPPDNLLAIAASESGYYGTLQMPGRAERVVTSSVSGRYAEVQRVRAPRSEN